MASPQIRDEDFTPSMNPLNPLDSSDDQEDTLRVPQELVATASPNINRDEIQEDDIQALLQPTPFEDWKKAKLQKIEQLKQEDDFSKMTPASKKDATVIHHTPNNKYLDKKTLIPVVLTLAVLSVLAWMTWDYFANRKVTNADQTKSQSKQSSSPAIVPWAWIEQTRGVFPVGSKVTIRSPNSGKYLRFVTEKEALANPNTVTDSGLVIEATGALDDLASQWMVRDVSGTYTQGLQSAVRLENVKYPGSFLKESPNPISRNPLFVWQAGQGGFLWSTIFATPFGSKNEVLICGASIALQENIQFAHDTLPFFLQSNPDGQILAPSKVPLGQSSHWIVQMM